jgi:hypothetical protein
LDAKKAACDERFHPFSFKSNCQTSNRGGKVSLSGQPKPRELTTHISSFVRGKQTAESCVHEADGAGHFESVASASRAKCAKFAHSAALAKRTRRTTEEKGGLKGARCINRKTGRDDINGG